MRARSDIQAVIHTHAPHAVAFSSLGKELVPVNNEAGYFYKKLPVFSETTDLIVTPERGKAVARCLGQNNAVLLRNHGIVAAGRSIEEAVWIALKLERACRVQLMAEWAGGPKLVAEGEDLEKKNKRGSRQRSLHQRVQLSRALLVPRARQGRRSLLRGALRDGFERVQGIADVTTPLRAVMLRSAACAKGRASGA